MRLIWDIYTLHCYESVWLLRYGYALCDWKASDVWQFAALEVLFVLFGQIVDEL